MNTEIRTDDLLMVAKRENNQKRSFLYVNPLQGKHIPVSPSRSLQVMELLAERTGELYKNESLLVIGFSETATAIGAALALSCPNVKAFLTTTREDTNGAEYIDFSESHSHATEQRLVVSGLEGYISCTDRIIFAEDEVTTGNTIEKLMNALQKRFPEKKLRFGIASLLNSMTDERLYHFAENDIRCTYLARIPFGYKVNDVDAFKYEPLRREPFSSEKHQHMIIKFSSKWDQRTVSGISTVRKACGRFVDFITDQFEWSDVPLKILVLGTEEFMYPGIIAGKALEDMGHTVRFHATSRSPIEISRDEGYPLHERSPLISFYEQGRETYIYNLEKYDRVIIVTDSPEICYDGLDTLIGALEKCGNTDISVIQWEDPEL